jgi:hypothetical protein
MKPGPWARSVCGHRRGGRRPTHPGGPTRASQTDFFSVLLAKAPRDAAAHDHFWATWKPNVKVKRRRR